MRIFEIKDLNLDFAGKVIFKDASLMVQDGEHIGLVGPNGAGKSTFLKLLTGEAVPDSWSLEKSDRLRIGYLDQFAEIKSSANVYGYLESMFGELYELSRQAESIYMSLAGLSAEEQEKALNRAEKIQEKLSEKGFDQIGKKINSVLAGLGFSERDKYKQTDELSGGMKTKLALAKILLQENDIIILDEPTNFLDQTYIDWLADYLPRLKCAYIVISHDINFLNSTCTRIVEIANRVFKSYMGDYDDYVRQKEIAEGEMLKQHTAQQKFIKRTEDYIAKSSRRIAGTARKINWLEKMLDSMELVEKPDEIIKPNFSFNYKKGASYELLTADNLEVGYGGEPVLPSVSLKIHNNDKVIIKGFNGIGKTTLLKTIYGDIAPVKGSVSLGNNIKSVFFRQEEDYENNFYSFNGNAKKATIKAGNNSEDITVQNFIRQYYPEKGISELQGMLLSCGLKNDIFFSRVRTLSGGEMTKLRLCIAMMSPVNFILLDEPTNHLDKYSREVLMHALGEFGGAVLMTTHDSNADISWATKVINLEDLFD